MVMESYWHVDYTSFIHFQISPKMKAVQKKEIKNLIFALEGHKNWIIRDEHPTSFCHIFQGKKELFKSDHQKYAFGRGSERSTH